MALFTRLGSLIAVIGASVAALKIADKVTENNPEGVPDHNGNGKVDLSDYAVEVKKATEDVYYETAETIKQKAPEAVENVKQAAEEVKEVIKEKYYEAKKGVSKPPDVIDIKPDSVQDADDLNS